MRPDEALTLAFLQDLDWGNIPELFTRQLADEAAVNLIDAWFFGPRDGALGHHNWGLGQEQGPARVELERNRERVV